ncbi:hypothetical protein Tco_0532260 [Tanacetum coccineum]
MEDEEVAMVDGVFEGAFGALGDKTWFGNGSCSKWMPMEERITKKKTKNEAKTTKPDSEWKSRKKDKVKVQAQV